MKYIFLLYFVLILIISSQAHALTVINSKYITELTPGSTDAFTMTLNPDNAGEIGIPLTVGMDEGNCSGWVTPDKTGITLSSGDSLIIASIAVPEDVYDGVYRCYVQYTTPSKSMVRSQLQVPVIITVSGGKEAPAPITTSAPAITVQAPAKEQEIPVSNPDYQPELPFGFTGLILVGCIGSSFIIVTVYDYRRGKK